MTGRPQLAPYPTDPGAGSGFPGYGQDAGLDLSGFTPDDLTGIAARFADGTADDLADALARVGNCAHPIRLHGQSHTIDATTGEVLASFTSTDAPLGMVLVPCGNRRAHVCPACSRTYAADTFQLIRAGVAGGKTIPTSVGGHPLVFATLTAPSFGHVHSTRDGSPCRPTTRGPELCRHGRPTTCRRVHDEDDDLIGQALCAGCYDYAGHVLWHYFAPELWRRFTIALRRALARRCGVPDSRLRDVATVQYAKVAEYQRRGAVHFHALVRLDGPATPDGFADPPAWLGADDLAALITDAAASVAVTAPAPADDQPARVLRFGRQLDARPVHTHRPDTANLGDGALSAEQVAGYLAKYATKAAGDPSADNPHLGRLRATCRRFADAARARQDEGEPIPGPDGRDVYLCLGKWVHMLGFRGHFASKSRRYSLTLGRLRQARRRYARLLADAARTGAPLDVADLENRLLAEDDDATTLVIGSWTYAGTNWPHTGDHALALAAAARAREHAQWRAEHRRSSNEIRTERGRRGRQAAVQGP